MTLTRYRKAFLTHPVRCHLGQRIDRGRRRHRRGDHRARRIRRRDRRHRGLQALHLLGMEPAAGLLSSTVSTRELAPIMAALAFAAQAGCRFTAQLGSMRISEEIDAMESLAIRPIPYLVTTRLLASVVAIIPLYILCLLINYAAVQTVVSFAGGLSAGTYDHYFRLVLTGTDILYSVLQSDRLRHHHVDDPVLLRLFRQRRPAGSGRRRRPRDARQHLGDDHRQPAAHHRPSGASVPARGSVAEDGAAGSSRRPRSLSNGQLLLRGPRRCWSARCCWPRWLSPSPKGMFSDHVEVTRRCSTTSVTVCPGFRRQVPRSAGRQGRRCGTRRLRRRARTLSPRPSIPRFAQHIPATVTARVVPSNVFAVSSIQLVDNGAAPAAARRVGDHPGREPGHRPVPDRADQAARRASPRPAGLGSDDTVGCARRGRRGHQRPW